MKPNSVFDTTDASLQNGRDWKAHNLEIVNIE